MPSVLLVEDDDAIRGAVVRALNDFGYATYSVGTGFDALREVARAVPDAVVLDLGLPDIDGVEVLRMMRGICDVPVIAATARDTEAEIIQLLREGADDYLVKPFSGEHLAARLAAVLRRSRPKAAERAFSAGDITVDLDSRQARLAGTELKLTRREFDLLAYLVARPHKVISREELLAEVWRLPPGRDDQTLDVHVSWLRRKLGESASAPVYLHTVRGVGIRLEIPGAP
ncbi:response regulator transcription factor [Allokutzneria albata]|uniref:DNA-binding response regulator, OmpR family, contains REC and winged-helix (WHTH) domain n=1 Tax=Allokutzneria albata TaxID=211114 RepID=A0A1H0DCN1_ALLAB|nr:response regulator transcription factor [Allokutzneria albata]SDN68027.1 DNA-binding response regulator, OmpR family, contains REC and winged-helix (wHTH) domain [Allokutzneria albata]